MTKKDYQKENEELKKDLDYLIKTFYGWGLSKKTYDGSDYTLDEEAYDLMTWLLDDGKKLSKKYRLYPYNQEVVRMKDEWESPYEDDGVTLGPEEALIRESEKTKGLKVEKLQLKDTIEKLQNENNTLTNDNHSLEQKLRSLTKQSSSSIFLETDQTHALRWAYFLLIFNLTALIILILFHLK